MAEDGKTLVESVAQMADSFDRLVYLLEEMALKMGVEPLHGAEPVTGDAVETSNPDGGSS
jgi:hypothetical protein